MFKLIYLLDANNFGAFAGQGPMRGGHSNRGNFGVSDTIQNMNFLVYQ